VEEQHLEHLEESLQVTKLSTAPCSQYVTSQAEPAPALALQLPTLKPPSAQVRLQQAGALALAVSHSTAGRGHQPALCPACRTSATGGAAHGGGGLNSVMKYPQEEDQASPGYLSLLDGDQKVPQ